MTREEFSHSSSDTQTNLELSEIAQLTDNGFPGCGNANPPATPGSRTPSVPLPCSRYRYSMSTTETRTFRSRHSRCCMGTAAVLLSLLTIGVFLGIMIHFTVIDVLWKDNSGIPKLPIPRADTSLGNTVPDFLGSVKISNLDWDYKLAVSDSLQYRDLAVRVEQELDRVFLLSPLKDIYNFSLVRTFRRGSIVAVFETVLTEHRSLTAASLKEAMVNGLDNRKYIRGPDDVIKNKHVIVLDADSIQIVALSTTTLREESTTHTLPMLISSGEGDSPTTTIYTETTSVNSSIQDKTIGTDDTVYDYNDFDVKVSSSPSPIPSWMWTPWRGTHFTPRVPTVFSVTNADVAYPHTVSQPGTQSPPQNVPASSPLPSTQRNSLSTTSLIHDLQTSLISHSFYTNTRLPWDLTTLKREAGGKLTNSPSQPRNKQTTLLEMESTALLTTSPGSNIEQKKTKLTTPSKGTRVTSVDIDEILDSIPGLSKARPKQNISIKSSSVPPTDLPVQFSSTSLPASKPSVSGKGFSTTVSSTKPNTLSSVFKVTTSANFTASSVNHSDTTSNISSVSDTNQRSLNQIPDVHATNPEQNTTQIRETNMTNIIENIPDDITPIQHTVRIPSTHVQNLEDPMTLDRSTVLIPVSPPGTRPSHSNGHGFAVKDYTPAELPTTTATRQREDVARIHGTVHHGPNTGDDKGFWAEGDSGIIPDSTHPFSEDYVFTEHPEELYDYMPRYPNNVANVFPNDADSTESTSYPPRRNMFEADDVESSERDVTGGIHDRAQFDDKMPTTSKNESEIRNPTLPQPVLPGGSIPFEHLISTRYNTESTTITEATDEGIISTIHSEDSGTTSKIPGEHMPKPRHHKVSTTIPRVPPTRHHVHSPTTSNIWEEHSKSTKRHMTAPTVSSTAEEHSTTNPHPVDSPAIARTPGVHSSVESSSADATDLPRTSVQNTPTQTTVKKQTEFTHVNSSRSSVINKDSSSSSVNATNPQPSPLPSAHGSAPSSTSSQAPVPAEYRAKVKGRGGKDSESDIADNIAKPDSPESDTHLTFSPGLVGYYSDEADVSTDLATSMKPVLDSGSITQTEAVLSVTAYGSAIVTSRSQMKNIVSTLALLPSVHQSVEEVSGGDVKVFNLSPTPVLEQMSTSSSNVFSISIHATVSSALVNSSPTTPADDNFKSVNDKVTNVEHKAKSNIENFNIENKEESAEPKGADKKASERLTNADDLEKVADGGEVMLDETRPDAARKGRKAAVRTPSSSEAGQSLRGVELLSSLLTTNVVGPEMITSSSVSIVPVLLSATFTPSTGFSDGNNNQAEIFKHGDPTSTLFLPEASSHPVSVITSSHMLSPSSADLHDLLLTTDELLSATSVRGIQVLTHSAAGFVDAASLQDNVHASVTPSTSKRPHRKEEEISNPHSLNSAKKVRASTYPTNACLDITVMTEFIPTCLDYFSQIMHTEDVPEKCQHFLAGVICVTDEFYKYSGQQCTESEIRAFIKQHAALFKNALPSFDPLQCVV